MFISSIRRDNEAVFSANPCSTSSLGDISLDIRTWSSEDAHSNDTIYLTLAEAQALVSLLTYAIEEAGKES